MYIFVYKSGARLHAGLSVHVSKTKTSSSGETAQVLSALNQYLCMKYAKTPAIPK